MSRRSLAILALPVLAAGSAAAIAQEKPNIVLVFMDNFGWAESAIESGALDPYEPQE